MSEQSKRISRQELYEKIWIAPLKKVAEELETTYAELARVCDELNVPKPTHGHWQRLKLGLPIEVFSLPEPTPGMAVEGMLKPKGLPKNKTIPATDHEMEKPPESTGVGQVDSGSPVTQCESPTIAEKCATSTEPKMPPAVEYTREQLYQALWNTPCTKLAAKLGVSDVALAKTCRRLGVPRPPRGYWARIEAGEN